MTDQELTEQFQTLVKMIEHLATKEDLKEIETRINTKIENQITQRIDALFDGYKLTHEKQWELERRADQLEIQLEQLQARIAALEEKTA